MYPACSHIHTPHTIHITHIICHILLYIHHTNTHSPHMLTHIPHKLMYSDRGLEVGLRDTYSVMVT